MPKNKKTTSLLNGWLFYDLKQSLINRMNLPRQLQQKTVWCEWPKEILFPSHDLPETASSLISYAWVNIGYYLLINTEQMYETAKSHVRNWCLCKACHTISYWLHFDEVDSSYMIIASLSFIAEDKVLGARASRWIEQWDLDVLGLFWFIQAKSPLRDLSIARAPLVQIHTSFSHFILLLSKDVATTWNTSVVVSSSLQNSISSSIEEGPTKRTKISKRASWSRSRSAVLFHHLE